LLSSIPDIVFFKNLRGRYLGCNPEFARFSNRNISEIIGFTDHDLFSKEIADSFREQDRRMMEQGVPRHNEEWITYADGARILIDTYKAPLRDAAGQVIGILGISRDITERKRTEDLLRLREAHLSAIIENQPGLVWLKDAESRFLAVNHSFAQACGLQSPDRLTSKTDFDIWPEELAKKYRADDAKVIASKKSFITEEQIFDAGESKWFETFKTPIFDAGGIVIGTTGYSRDITERKNAEDVLLQMSDRLKLAVRAGGVGIWDYDVVNHKLIWDDQMYLLYGITRDQFSGVYDAWRTGLHSEDLQRGDNEIQMALRGEKEFDTEFRVLWPNGITRHIRALALVQRDVFGKPLRMVGTNWDITEIKKAEKLLRELDQRKTAFVANVSHELKNPLSVIRESMTLILDKVAGDVSEQQKEILVMGKRSTDRLIRLVSDLLDLAHIEAGKMVLKRERVDICALVDEVLKTYEREISKKQLVLQRKIQPDAGFLLGDRDKLTEVIINLLNNAIKYTPRGSITVGVTGSPKEIRFEIADTGPGIPEEYFEKIFDKFERIMTEKQEGTGLGLPIAKDIIELHQGKLWVESEPGKGSTFIFTLPLGVSSPVSRDSERQPFG